jgi:hypothetical protein
MTYKGAPPLYSLSAILLASSFFVSIARSDEAQDLSRSLQPSVQPFCRIASLAQVPTDRQQSRLQSPRF